MTTDVRQNVQGLKFSAKENAHVEKVTAIIYSDKITKNHHYLSYDVFYITFRLNITKPYFRHPLPEYPLLICITFSCRCSCEKKPLVRLSCNSFQGNLRQPLHNWLGFLPSIKIPSHV